MGEERELAIEGIQRMIARLVATTPAGHNLRLIGGFRYRFLDESARFSSDIDYHWEGDLQEKQAELAALFARRLLPDIKRRLGYEGDVRIGTGPEADSIAVRAIELAFWRPGVAYSRIELPVEIKRIICLDALAVRTAGGVVYLTSSDADLIESKVIALFNRRVIEHRDFCDLFLFANHLVPNAPQRLEVKFAQLGIGPDRIAHRLRHFREGRDYHAGAIEDVLADQLDSSAAAGIVAAGGGKLVLDTVLEILSSTLRLAGGPS